MGLIFQSNSPQPYHLEAIAEELAQIGDEFYQEFEYAEEPFSAHEFLQLLNEVTQRRGSSTNNIENRSRFGIIVRYSVVFSLCVGLTVAWFYCRTR
ncbi:unnamed protein product [Fasciola hepatica]|uniref:Uncharacterized protein n=2 Tax=Fasciola hepatica TaxID=6192 RepID=A0A4E0REI1_FASHE|nr:hypothetical protein D915_004164 [Fasciola hepatica]CAK6928633.1 unnamed protein product [Fasciola hepatica]